MTEPLLGPKMSYYNSTTDDVKLLEGAGDMATTPPGDERGTLTSSLGQSSLASTEESLRKRGTSSPGSDDDFIRIEVRESRGEGWSSSSGERGREV